jgi:hypothetical protein
MSCFHFDQVKRETEQKYLTYQPTSKNHSIHSYLNIDSILHLTCFIFLKIKCYFCCPVSLNSLSVCGNSVDLALVLDKTLMSRSCGISYLSGDHKQFFVISGEILNLRLVKVVTDMETI